MEFIVKEDLMEELEKKSYSYGSKRFIREFPTVKAIPIEWIKKWCNKEHNKKSLEERLLKRYGVITMLADWEKENGRSE